MLVVIILVLAGIAVGYAPDLMELVDDRRRWRMADHSGYSPRELRRITSSVLRKDRRRSRYGIRA